MPKSPKQISTSKKLLINLYVTECVTIVKLHYLVTELCDNMAKMLVLQNGKGGQRKLCPLCGNNDKCPCELILSTAAKN